MLWHSKAQRTFYSKSFLFNQTPIPNIKIDNKPHPLGNRHFDVVQIKRIRNFYLLNEVLIANLATPPLIPTNFREIPTACSVPKEVELWPRRHRRSPSGASTRHGWKTTSSQISRPSRTDTKNTPIQIFLGSLATVHA